MQRNHLTKWNLFQVGILLLSLLPTILFAQKSKSSFDRFIQAEKTLYGFNGNVLVAKNGNIIYQNSFGYADYFTKAKLDRSSVFDIGSIAKEFTAVGILMLKDKGLLSLTDSLGKLLPQLPYKNITIQQLLTHTSGMPDGYDLVEKYFDHNKVATNNDLLNLLTLYKPNLYFKPGQDLRYSGTGFNLLACIIEKLSGTSYKDFMDANIFKPLKMQHTMVANYPRLPGKIEDYATGYVYSDSLKKYTRADGLYINWVTYFSGITGEGMIVSTAEDMLKWDRALNTHHLLSVQSQKEMLTIQAKKKTFPLVQFGYGMRVGNNQLGNYNFHNGWYPGYKSMHIHYGDYNITVIVLSNNESQSEFIADGLATIAAGKNIQMPYRHKEKNIAGLNSKFIGKYLLPVTSPPYMVNSPASIIEKEKILYLSTGRGPDIALSIETPNKLFYNDGTDQQIEYKMNKNGHDFKMWYTGWGVKREIKKMDSEIKEEINKN